MLHSFQAGEYFIENVLRGKANHRKVNPVVEQADQSTATRVS